MPRFRKSVPLEVPPESVVGTVRHARHDSDFAGLRPGDVAVVNLPDLDARHAHDLIAAQVSAVLNTAPSSTGRVPNQGPSLLAGAAIVLVDVQGDSAWTALREGDSVVVHEGRVLRDGAPVVSGVVLDSARVASTLEAAKEGVSTRLDSLAANATDHIQREQAMLLDGARVPRLRTRLRGRSAVVVAKDYLAESDLASIKRYIAERDPVLIGAGPGAEVLLDAGYTPHLLVGDLDRLSDRAIRASGEVVVTTPTGRVNRPERLERHGKEVVTFTSTGSDDDLAVLLADTNDASVIVQVGAPPTLADVLERAPSEAARMVVARLRAGAKIVDAKSVAQLSARPMATWPLFLLALTGLAAVAAAITVTPVGQDWFDQLRDALSDLGSSIGGLFS